MSLVHPYNFNCAFIAAVKIMQTGFNKQGEYINGWKEVAL